MKKVCSNCKTEINVQCFFKMGEIRHDGMDEPCNICEHNRNIDDTQYPCNFCSVPHMKAAP